MKQDIYKGICDGKATANKAFAVLIDPDKLDETGLTNTIALAVEAKVDYFFVLFESSKQIKYSFEKILCF